MKKKLVSNWMTKDVITIAPETTLKNAHDIMNKKNIRRPPVVSDGKLLGIVTLGDIRGAESSQATSLSVWEVNHLLADLPFKFSVLISRSCLLLLHIGPLTDPMVVLTRIVACYAIKNTT